MKPIDVIIIVVLALIVGGILAWIIVNKIKGKNIGCDCGGKGGCASCSSCSSCFSCPSAGNCNGEKYSTEEKSACPHCAAKAEKEEKNV